MMHVTDRLQRYLDGELDDGEAREVTVHLQDCAACRREGEDLRALWQSVATAVTPVPAVSVWPALSARRSVRHRATPSPWLRGGVAVAALVAGLALGLGVDRGVGTVVTGGLAEGDDDDFLQTLTTLDQIWWSAGTQDDMEVGS